ncbi:MAG: response regulator [Elusimicrobiota bacterium]
MRILVAEDDDINRELITEILTSEGHEVIGVSDGQELIKTSLSYKPDLILTDIQMPNMSGDTMIAMIEEYDDLVKTPVVIMTGMGETEFKKLGISKDINVIFKPINVEKLKEIISKLAK